MRRSRPRWSSHKHPRHRSGSDADPCPLSMVLPVDWPQLSAVIRFRRAQGKCEGRGRPHGRVVCHLGDGRWWDRDERQWRDGRGRPIRQLPALWLWKGTIRTTRVVLACSHLDHDPTNNRPSNLKANAATCCTTRPSISAGAGSRCSGAEHSATSIRGGISS